MCVKMIEATVRPILSIKPGWVHFPRPTPRLINEPLSRHISGRRNDRKVKRDAPIFKSPKQSFPIPAAATLRPDRSHDLLVAVAELGALEQRIGYRFNDKLLGLSAFKTSPPDNPVKFQSLSASFQDWKRLALLGDRALDLALCHTWYQSGNSRCKYHCSMMVPGSLNADSISVSYASTEERLVTRRALARKGLKIHLDRNILTNGFSLSHHILGEVFEALIGAIYLDSQSNLHAVQKVLRNIGFSEVRTDVETSATERSVPQEASSQSTSVTTHSDPVDGNLSVPGRQIQIKPHLDPTPIPADNTNGIGDETSKEPSVATGVSLDHGQSNNAVLVGNPHILSIYRDLVEIFPRRPSRLQIPKNQDELRTKIFGSLHECFEVYFQVKDLCSWFPALQARYARFYGAHLKDKSKNRGLGEKRYLWFFNSSFIEKEQPPLLGSVGPKAAMHDMLESELRRATNARYGAPFNTRTVVEALRHFTNRGESDVLLNALYIEERVRDYIRRQAGFPDWYDLPENRDKVLPPWRVLQSELPPHAEMVIPMEVLLRSESSSQPPLLLDTIRQPDSQSDTMTSYHEQLARSDRVRFAHRERGGYRLSPSRSMASSAWTVMANTISSEKHAGLLQHDIQVHPYAIHKGEKQWSKRHPMHQSDWLYFCGSPLSICQHSLRKNEESHAQKADVGPKAIIAKSLATSIEADSIQIVPMTGPLSPHSSHWRQRWVGKALEYLYYLQDTKKESTALSKAAENTQRPTRVGDALYFCSDSPLLCGRFVTRNSDFEITELTVSTRIEPYSSCNPTDDILGQENSDTESTSAKSTIADTTRSSRRSKTVSAMQKPYEGRRMRSAIASMEAGWRGRIPAKPQSAISHAQEGGPPGPACTQNFIREIDNSVIRKMDRSLNGKTNPYPRVRPRKCISAPFWRKRSPEDGTKADTAPPSIEAQNLMNLVRPDRAPERDDSKALATDAATKCAITQHNSLGHTCNQSSDADHRNQGPGLKPAHEPKDQPDKPKTAFGKLSAIMTGNRIWFEEQVSKAVPTFTSFDPVKRASGFKQDSGLKDPFRDLTTARSARPSGSEEESESEEQKSVGCNLVRRFLSRKQ